MFRPVRTLDDLMSLSEADIIEGYMAAERGDPEPGENRGRAYWHGWRNRMMDLGEIKTDEAAQRLAREWLAWQRAHQAPIIPASNLARLRAGDRSACAKS